MIGGLRISHSLFKRFVWFLEAAAVSILSFPLAVLPYNGSIKAGEFLGLFLFHAWASRRRIAVANIEKAIRSGGLGLPQGDASGIARESFMNLGRSFAEVIRLYYGRGEGVIKRIEIRGTEHYRRAEAKGRGVILITAHCGNWELLALVFGAKVARAYGVARLQDNPYLNRMIEKVRASYGNGLLYKKGALKGILSCLKKKIAVGILIDQAVVKDEGVIIKFLGSGAWTTKMPALIARKTGAPVVPVFINREGAGHVITIHPEAPLVKENDADSELLENTQLMSEYVERQIRSHPTEWLWIHRRWKRVEENQ